MNIDTKKDEKLLDFFMGDNLKIKEHFRKKPDKKPWKAQNKQMNEGDVHIPTGDAGISSDDKNISLNDKGSAKETQIEDHVDMNVIDPGGKCPGEVDYAILKSISYGFKTNKEIARSLKIRSIIVEKHVYNLLKEGFIKYFQYAILTTKGKAAITGFEKDNSKDVWKPIDEYIISVIEYKNDRNLRWQKRIDTILLGSIIILIVLIIYFGVFY